MSIKEVIYCFFYASCFLFGMRLQVTKATVILPVQLFLKNSSLIIGVFIFIIHLVMINNTKVHWAGLTINGFVIAYVILSSLIQKACYTAYNFILQLKEFYLIGSMHFREILYYIFYIGCFALAVGTGIIFGFHGDSHTPPIPFGIEFFALPIGLLLYIADKRFSNTTKVHKIGIILNAAVMAFTIILTLAS